MIIWGVHCQGFFPTLSLKLKLAFEDPSLSFAKLTTVVHHEFDPWWGFKWSYRLPYLVTLKEKFSGGPKT